jgi:hypothetical protein
MLVDRVVENLENAVVQAALIGVADVHAGPLADSLQAFEFVDLRGTVLLVSADVRIGLFRLLMLFGHGRAKGLKCPRRRQGLIAKMPD